MAELLLVRHAQASFDAADYDCLSPLGERQARWLGEHFDACGRGFDLVVSGTLKRHAQTVEGIRAGLGTDARWAEGSHSGLDEYDFRALVTAYEALEPSHPLVKARQSNTRDKSAYYRVLRLALTAWAEEQLQGPLPQTWAAFREGVEQAAAWLQGLSATHERILAVSSGGAMATLLGGRLGLGVSLIVDLNLQIRNTSVSQFFLNRERFLLATWNAIPHLEVPGREDSISYG